MASDSVLKVGAGSGGGGGGHGLALGVIELVVGLIDELRAGGGGGGHFGGEAGSAI